MQITLKNRRNIAGKFFEKFSNLDKFFCNIVNFGQTKNAILDYKFFVSLIIAYHVNLQLHC